MITNFLHKRRKKREKIEYFITTSFVLRGYEVGWEGERKKYRCWITNFHEERCVQDCLCASRDVLLSYVLVWEIRGVCSVVDKCQMSLSANVWTLLR